MHTQVLIEEFSQRGKKGARRIASTHKSQEDAVETAKAIIESGLMELWHRGMSAQSLMQAWADNGEEVQVLPESGDPCAAAEACFSSMDYARARAAELAVRGRL